MNNQFKILALALSLTAITAVAFAADSAQKTRAKHKAGELKPRTEISYFDGQVGLEYTILTSGKPVIGDRTLTVSDLDPNSPKLLSAVSDDRIPLSGFVDINGTLIRLRLQPDGLLAATIPSYAIHWYSANNLRVEVFDGGATTGGAPTGRKIHEWVTVTGALL